MATDMFLKIDGIDGESSDDKHANWIEILSFSFGASQPATGSVSSGGARSSQRVDLQDFSVVKQLDKASPKLFLHCCNGKHIPKVTLELCRATGDKQKYMAYLLEDVLVSSVRPGGSSEGADLPLEEVSFNAAKTTMTYTETDHLTGGAKGDVEAYWDQGKNIGG
jgi:type VI secretion system secreted protein Hcp